MAARADFTFLIQEAHFTIGYEVMLGIFISLEIESERPAFRALSVMPGDGLGDGSQGDLLIRLETRGAYERQGGDEGNEFHGGGHPCR